MINTETTSLPWTEEELQRLQDVYPAALPEEISQLFPGRTESAVKQRANKMYLCHSERKVFFPKSYDNVADGNYVSGLVDGEGSFMVSIVQRRGRWNFNPKFGVCLRVDDSEILHWLQIYFGCGRYTTALNRKSPLGIFVIANLYDILSKVIPHFDTFPLRAKKKRDYAIWKQMVLLQARYFRQPWPDEVRAEMQRLYIEIKETRQMVEKEDFHA